MMCSPPFNIIIILHISFIYEGYILIVSVRTMIMDETRPYKLVRLTRVASRGVTGLYLWRRPRSLPITYETEYYYLVPGAQDS